MVKVRLARVVMATRFELLLEGEDEIWLRAAGEEALREVERIDAQLSIYRPSSELSRLNALAAGGAVRVEPRLFRLLQTAMRISEETDGAFDLTVEPLMRAWGFFRESGRRPDPEVLEKARAATGMHLVELDPAESSVRFVRSSVRLDPGAIGKGYAVDEAMGILSEAGVQHAFLHGGTSTIAAFGAPADAPSWRVAVTYPGEEELQDERSLLAVVPLNNSSLSVSAVWGKAFETEGRTFGHVIDPRLGRPVDGALMAAIEMPSATEADAYSTALLVLGRQCGKLLAKLRDRSRSVILFPRSENDQYEIFDGGLSPLPSERFFATQFLDTS